MHSSPASGVGQPITPLTHQTADPSSDTHLSVDQTEKTKPEMKSRADTNSALGGLLWEEVPVDIVIRIFDALAQQVLNSDKPGKTGALHALIQFGSLNKSQYRYFKDFLENHSSGQQIKAEISDFRQGAWKQHAARLKEKSTKLRDDFSNSASIICAWGLSFNSSNSSSAVNSVNSLPDLAEFQGVCINFSEFAWKPEMAMSISSITEKVMKLDGGGIGRDRFFNELIPFLHCVSSSCQILLEISDNQLRGKDLTPLLEYIETNPNVYRLDLSKNPLFDRNECCAEVLQLFGCDGPLTHFYLSHTGFNDLTAAGLKEAIATGSLLEHLDLRNNELTENGVIAVMRAIVPGGEPDQKVIKSIRTVRLFNNQYADSDRLYRERHQVIHDIERFTESDPELGVERLGIFGIPIRKFSYSDVFEIGRDSDAMVLEEGVFLVGGQINFDTRSAESKL